MRQLFQSYKTGKLTLAEVPMGLPGRGELLVATVASVVSAGTEKSMVELARKSLLGKALARPDLVRQVIAKARAEGIMEAWKQAMGRLDVPVALGYSSAGVVTQVGPGVEGFSVGDRVACAGSGYAGHSETARVPVNLCVKLPEGVDFQAAAFVALGGIALESVRMARVSLGETVLVIGLGLLGQTAVQILRAAGCHVIAMDIDPSKVDMALQRGAEAGASDYQSLATMCRRLTSGLGADAAILMATTPSNEPLEQAAELCRERGRISVVGQVGLEVPRKPFYDKELELVVSRAWGPGLYDPQYADKGVDYPVGYVRWTAGRNMDEFLKLLGGGSVNVDDMITHRFPLDRASEAYELILEGTEPYMGVVLTYPEDAPAGYLKGEQGARVVTTSGATPVATGPRPRADQVSVGLVGAGLFARGTLLPILKGMKGARLRAVATSTGLSGRHIADKFGFDYCAASSVDLLEDPDIDLVMVLTRNGSHAHLVAQALAAGKHVFVEKPLALDVQQLQGVTSALSASSGQPPILMVGFNRRFSPCALWLKERFAGAGEPLAVHCTVNAGPIPPEHWTYDPQEGGGRIIGEACHFVDLIQFFTDSVPVRVSCEALESGGYKPSDNVAITLKMANGSVASVTYVAGGDKRFPRERVEVFGGGAAGVIDDFKSALFIRGGRTSRRRTGVDRGHSAEMEALVKAIRDGQGPPVSPQGYVDTTVTTFAAEESLRQVRPVELADLWPPL